MDSGIVRRRSDTPTLEQLPTEIQYPADPARSYAPLPAEGFLLREYWQNSEKENVGGHLHLANHCNIGHCLHPTHDAGL